MPSLRLLSQLCLMTIICACSGTNVELPRDISAYGQPKNVIFLIGDGMGLAQITAAMYHNNNKLALEQFPVIGFHKSHASDQLITDSAAGATAFACGVKTYYNAIGVDKDTIPCKTLMEEAKERNLATGLVVTSTLVHATPASFYAHQTIRTKYEEIAVDLVDSGIDFLIGGGKRYFDRREYDDRNLYKELEKKDYKVGNYFDQPFTDFSTNTSQKVVFFTADTDPVPVSAGRKYLPYATRRALQYLDKRTEEGFFLMVEGSQIDWAGHANNAELVIDEILDFNKMIEVVLNYAKKKGNTLVVVTADHETGGMGINKESKMGEIKAEFTTNGHTASMIPVFAYGPSAKLFSGIYENTAINHKIREALGFDDSESAGQ